MSRPAAALRSSSSKGRPSPASPRSPIASAGTERWTDPAFIATAHAWMRAACARHGREVQGAIEQSHTWPWSTVFWVRTPRGVVFLKCCGPSQAHEPKLTALLQRVAPRDVPTLVARHPRRDWMLLEDGGRKIREVARGRELLREWEGILPRYAAIQIALLGRGRELSATGTPDHRLERLASGVAAILEDTTVTRRAGCDQLSASDRRRIRATRPLRRAGRSGDRPDDPARRSA